MVQLYALSVYVQSRLRAQNSYIGGGPSVPPCELLAQQPSEFDPRKALLAAKNAARGIVKARYEAFGCVGQGSKIKPVALEAMARRYG